MSEVVIETGYWETKIMDIVEHGFSGEDLDHLIEIKLTEVTEAPAETVMGKATERKEAIFDYLKAQLGITQEELMSLEGKKKPARLASSEILVRIIAACHVFEIASQLSEVESGKLKEQAVIALNLDLLPRFWKGMARGETLVHEGKEKSHYHFLRDVGLTPASGIKYLPEPKSKMPELLNLLEEKVIAKVS